MAHTFFNRGKKGSTGPNQLPMVSIPLGGGNTLMLPADGSNGEECLGDLDDDAIQRLIALRSQVDNMLKIREDS